MPHGAKTVNSLSTRLQRSLSSTCTCHLLLTLALAFGARSALAQTETVLHNFTGYPSDGSTPQADLISDASGNLFGTTYAGGSNNQGTVFEVSASGTELVLYNLGGPLQAANPLAFLAKDSNGNLFTTSHNGGNGIGTFFEISNVLGTWVETGLYSFSSSTDGSYPEAGFIIDSSGNLYSTTFAGGSCGAGTVFKLTPPAPPSTTWTKSILHNFCGGSTDGANPEAGIMVDASGNLYGTTYNGGANTTGTVFELTPNLGNSWSFLLLHSFGAVADGQFPAAGLVMDASGNLYGTTVSGGAYGCGIVFEMIPVGDGAWNEQSLYAFLGGTDGKNLYSRLLLDSIGNLYGTTSAGGSGINPQGTVFKLAPGFPYTKTILHNFCNTGDGCTPYAGLVMDESGNLYGTTSAGALPVTARYSKLPNSWRLWSRSGSGIFVKPSMQRANLGGRFSL